MPPPLVPVVPKTSVRLPVIVQFTIVPEENPVKEKPAPAFVEVLSEIVEFKNFPMPLLVKIAPPTLFCESVLSMMVRFP